MKLLFKITPQLVELVNHCLKNKAHYDAPYGQGKSKVEGPILVKDHGIYLISPEISESAPKDARLYSTNGRLVCCYAEDCGPNTRFSGDDFAFQVEYANWYRLDKHIGKHLLIVLRETTYTVSISLTPR